jgi:hypothetical protein
MQLPKMTRTVRNGGRTNRMHISLLLRYLHRSRYSFRNVYSGILFYGRLFLAFIVCLYNGEWRNNRLAKGFVFESLCVDRGNSEVKTLIKPRVLYAEMGSARPGPLRVNKSTPQIYLLLFKLTSQ